MGTVCGSIILLTTSLFALMILRAQVLGAKNIRNVERDTNAKVDRTADRLLYALLWGLVIFWALIGAGTIVLFG